MYEVENGQELPPLKVSVRRASAGEDQNRGTQKPRSTRRWNQWQPLAKTNQEDV
jgi:hypothetical protein